MSLMIFSELVECSIVAYHHNIWCVMMHNTLCVDVLCNLSTSLLTIATFANLLIF